MTTINFIAQLYNRLLKYGIIGAMLKLFRSFRYWLLASFVFLVIVVAFIFFAKPADFLAERASDLVRYLVMQKRYIFDKYTDPNVYPELATVSELDQTLIDLKVSTSTDVIRLSNSKPIVVSTTTVPAISEPLATSSIPVSRVATSVPGLIIKNLDITLTPLPEPTVVSAPNQPGDSTKILAYTNTERTKAGLGSLISSAVLDKVALGRLNDLFFNQYFSHDSPTGHGVPELAKEYSYAYSLIGENLALGNFDGDKGVVQAWMESPGHRANILNAKYKELGVAQRVDNFKGDEVTIAVQIFGLPMASCRQPSAQAKKIIAQNTEVVDRAEAEASSVYKILVSLKGNPDIDQAYYNQKVEEYNYFARNVNKAITALKKMAETYNLQINQYNSCILQS
jgi:uncharacterized protein YkwD